MVVTAPNKKQRLTLKPPQPNTSNLIDTVSRLNIEVSKAGYSLAWATKGPPSSSEKPFTLPLEQKVSNRSDMEVNTHLNCYGLAKRKAQGTSNTAKQFGWYSNGHKKWNDWKVR